MIRPRLVLPLLACALLATGCTEPDRQSLASDGGAPAAARPATDPSPASTATPAASTAATPTTEDPMPERSETDAAAAADAKTTETATFGSGCFWCTEAVLEQLDGVLDVTSGYMGGHVDEPTYEQVCAGTTGHAEVVQVTFDPSRISYSELLDWFFRSHDPTTLNRQGADIGTQYRSAIFTHSPEQHERALAKIRDVQPSFADPIVTELTQAGTFWPAEAYHQDYYRQNPGQGYCRVVIRPKLDKLGLDPDPGR